MTHYSLQGLAEKVAAVAAQDAERTKNQLRTWLSNDMIPVAVKVGQGVGTRRVYDERSAYVGVALARLAQFGISGESLKAKADSLGKTFPKIQGKTYMIVYPDDDRCRLVRSETVEDVSDLSINQGDAVLVLDLAGIKRLVDG